MPHSSGTLLRLLNPRLVKQSTHCTSHTQSQSSCAIRAKHNKLNVLKKGKVRLGGVLLDWHRLDNFIQQFHIVSWRVLFHDTAE